jgi:peptidyl-tRNA hydrolase
MMSENLDIRLYILVRNDLESLTPGKMCAQVSHAANQCVYEIRKSGDQHSNNLLNAWQEDRGFGTCIVLSAELAEIYKVVQQAKTHSHVSGITHDPSYPLRDGNFTHLIPVDTCAFVFGKKENLEPFLSHLPLR